MKPINFEEANSVLAKDQPEYTPLPVNIRPSGDQFIFTSCWKLTIWERIKLLWSGKVWCEQLVFHALQPQKLSIEKPI